MEELGRKKSRLGGRLGGTHAQASKQTLPTAPNTTRTYGLPGISQLIGRGTLGFNYLALLFTFLNSKQTLTQQLNSGENGCQMSCFSWWSRVGRDSWLAFVRIVWAAPSTTTTSSPRWLWLTEGVRAKAPKSSAAFSFPLSLCPHSYRSREARRHSQPALCCAMSLHSCPHKGLCRMCTRFYPILGGCIGEIVLGKGMTRSSMNSCCILELWWNSMTFLNNWAGANPGSGNHWRSWCIVLPSIVADW